MDFSTFLRDYLNDYMRQVQLGLPGKIEKFDKKKMRADVQPFMKIKNNLDEETSYPILADLPVLYINAGDYYIRPEYKRGDIVWITFSTFDISNAMDEYTRAESTKLFGLENACVAGAIASNKFSAPTEFNSEDGLVIGHKDGNAYLLFAKDKITMKFSKSAQEIVFDSTGISCDGEVVGNAKSMPIKLTLHKHLFTGMGSVGTPIP